MSAHVFGRMWISVDVSVCVCVCVCVRANVPVKRTVNGCDCDRHC